jgi:hypothetical protein
LIVDCPLLTSVQNGVYGAAAARRLDGSGRQAIRFERAWRGRTFLGIIFGSLFWDFELNSELVSEVLFLITIAAAEILGRCLHGIEKADASFGSIRRCCVISQTSEIARLGRGSVFGLKET